MRYLVLLLQLLLICGTFAVPPGNDQYSDAYLSYLKKLQKDYQITGYNLYKLLNKDAPISNKSKIKIDNLFGINVQLLNTLEKIILKEKYPNLFLSSQNQSNTQNNKRGTNSKEDIDDIIESVPQLFDQQNLSQNNTIIQQGQNSNNDSEDNDSEEDGNDGDENNDEVDSDGDVDEENEDGNVDEENEDEDENNDEVDNDGDVDEENKDEDENNDEVDSDGDENNDEVDSDGDVDEENKDEDVDEENEDGNVDEENEDEDVDEENEEEDGDVISRSPSKRKKRMRAQNVDFEDDDSDEDEDEGEDDDDNIEKVFEYRGFQPSKDKYTLESNLVRIKKAKNAIFGSLDDQEVDDDDIYEERDYEDIESRNQRKERNNSYKINLETDELTDEDESRDIDIDRNGDGYRDRYEGDDREQIEINDQINRIKKSRQNPQTIDLESDQFKYNEEQEFSEANNELPSQQTQSYKNNVSTPPATYYINQNQNQAQNSINRYNSQQTQQSNMNLVSPNNNLFSSNNMGNNYNNSYNKTSLPYNQFTPIPNNTPKFSPTPDSTFNSNQIFTNQSDQGINNSGNYNVPIQNQGFNNPVNYNVPIQNQEFNNPMNYNVPIQMQQTNYQNITPIQPLNGTMQQIPIITSVQRSSDKKSKRRISKPLKNKKDLINFLNEKPTNSELDNRHSYLYSKGSPSESFETLHSHHF